MLALANFEQLNTDITNVLDCLTGNQNLCKLLTYTSNNPFQEPDIDEPSETLMTHIFPFPRVPEGQSEKTSHLLVLHDSFRLGENKGTKEWRLKFEIIIHNDLWILSGIGKLRPFCIMHELDEMFNKQRIVGIKKLQLDGTQFVRYNEKFSGYSLWYNAVSAN